MQREKHFSCYTRWHCSIHHLSDTFCRLGSAKRRDPSLVICRTHHWTNSFDYNRVDMSENLGWKKLQNGKPTSLAPSYRLYHSVSNRTYYCKSDRCLESHHRQKHQTRDRQTHARDENRRRSASSFRIHHLSAGNGQCGRG